MAVLRRAAVAVAALLLVALGLLIVVQVVAGLIGEPWPIPRSWATSLMAVATSDWRVTLVMAGIAVLGLLIILGSFVLGRPRRLPTGLADPWWVLRGSAESRLAEAANRAGVVGEARSNIRASHERWRVQISGEAPATQRAAVEQAVRDELRGLGAPADLEVSVDLRQRGLVS